MISAKAYGVLRFIQDNPDKVSADTLADVFPEGRAYFLSALKELRDAGFIVTCRKQINGRWVTYSVLSELGHRSSETALLSPQSQQNSNKELIHIHTETVKNPPTGSETYQSMEVNLMAWGGLFESQSSMDKEDKIAEARKAQKNALAEFREQQEAKQEKRITHRSQKPKSSWTSSDVAYEFADRINQNWNIKPFTVTQTRFIQALSLARKKQQTDGEIECRAIDLFFGAIKIDKYKDGDVLWKMFVSQFPGLIHQLRDMVQPDADVTEESRARTAKSIARFED